MVFASDHVVTGGEAVIPMLLVGGILVATGVFVVTTARRLADGRIAKNWLLGIRTPATLASDGAWLAAHRAGERDLVRCGWSAAVTGPAAIAVGAGVGAGDAERALAGWGVALGIGVVVMLWFGVRAAVVGHRAAKAIVTDAG